MHGEVACRRMRTWVLGLVVATSAVAQPMRLERLTVVEGEAVPIIFWRDGRLCVVGGSAHPETDEKNKGRARCHAVKASEATEATLSPIVRGQSTKTLRANWHGVKVTIDQKGNASIDGASTVARLRCGGGRLHELGEYRFAVGSDGEIAVIGLEEDDLDLKQATLDTLSLSRAASRIVDGTTVIELPNSNRLPRQWVVLYATKQCAE